MQCFVYLKVTILQLMAIILLPWMVIFLCLFNTICGVLIQVIAEFWSFPDRTTYLGKIISSYLSGGTELQSDMVHLLFAANRFEKR